MQLRLTHALLALAAVTASASESDDMRPSVLVTGATGRTGSLLYFSLASNPAVREVRALVTSIDDARAALNCSVCDESEGVYLGDVTNASTLLPAARGVDTVAIAVGVSGDVPEDVQKAVEFGGVQNTVAALAQPANQAGGTTARLRVVLCSSMGTTDPDPSPMEGGSVLFWKLNAEAFLGASGVGSTVVKPCGLSDGAPNASALLVGHDDALLSTSPPMISRADVAAVMAQAVVSRSAGLRFDLCSERGAPPADLNEVLDSARWPWEQ